MTDTGIMETRATNERELTLADVLHFVLRLRWFLLIGLVLGSLLGGMVALNQQPFYAANMTLEFRSARQPSIGMESAFGMGNVTNQSNLAIPVLQSRSLAQEVVQRMALNADIQNISDIGFIKSVQRRMLQFINPPPNLALAGWTGSIRYYFGRLVGDPGPIGSISIRDLSVDPKLRHRIFDLVLNPDNERFQIFDERNRMLAEGRKGIPFSLTIGGHSLSFMPVELFAGHATRLQMGFRSLENAAATVQGSIDIKSLGRGAENFLQVSCRWSDPYMASSILNVLAEVYQQRDRKETTKHFDQVIAFLDDNLLPMEQRLENAEKNLKSFLTTNRVVDLSAENKRVIESIAEFERKRLDSQLKREELDHLDVALQKAAPGSYGTLLAEINPSLAVAWEKLQERQTELVQEGKALVGFTEDYPRVQQYRRALKALEQRIEELRKQAVEAISQQKILYLERDRTLAASIQNLEHDIGMDPEIQNQFMRLQRQKAVAEKLYAFLLEKREEMRLNKAGEVAKVQVLDRPMIGAQVSPDVRRSLLVGGFLGGILLGLVGFLRERLDIAIKDIDELEHKTGLYVHGAIPSHAEAEEETGLVTLVRPRSPDAEAYRTLRTSIQLSSLEHQVKSILITSSGPGQGKSTTTSNLAVTLAQAGKRTLVVDCDMRKPVANKLLHVELEPGLAEVLDQSLDWRGCVAVTAVENLFVLPAGKIPGNPSELLGRESMYRLIAEAKQEYDFVLFDVPPILVVSDAALLASHMDGVLILVRAGTSSVHEVERASAQMKRVGGQVLGAIFNGYTVGGKGYGYGRYGYGRYGYGRYGYGRYGYGGYYQKEPGNVTKPTIRGYLIKLFTGVVKKKRNKG